MKPHQLHADRKGRGMTMHHHGGAVADKDSVDCALGKQAGEGVVVAGNHRKLVAIDLRAEEIAGADRGRVRGLCWHRLGTCQKSIKSRTYMQPRMATSVQLSLRYISAR